MLFIYKTFLVYKLETFTNCKEVKHIMIMIIVIISIFVILWGIWSTIENYFQKILMPPWKNPPPPLKIQRVKVTPFLPTLKNFQSPPLQKGGGRTPWGHLGGRTPFTILIMVTEQLYWIKILCVCFCFIWLWLLIAIMKRCAEQCTLQLYHTSLIVTEPIPRKICFCPCAKKNPK